MSEAPDAAAIEAWIVATYADADVVKAGSGVFFSCDPEKHWPNFATIVTSDEYDQFSDLDHPGDFRLNVGVGRATFDAFAGADALEGDHDFTARDRVLPHPVYGAQRWLSIINPSAETFETVGQAARRRGPRDRRRPRGAAEAAGTVSRELSLSTSGVLSRRRPPSRGRAASAPGAATRRGGASPASPGRPRRAARGSPDSRRSAAP